MADPDRSERPGRALLVALSAMAGVAVLVGLAVGGAAMTVVKLTGVGESSGGSGRAQASLVMPRYRPTQQTGSDRGPAGSLPSKKQRGKTPEASPKADRIKLFAAPQRVSPGDRINFNGVYLDGEGVALQIQRKENGSWVNFPVKVTVQGGGFETWIETSKTGRSEFRVYDREANRTSNVAVVTVG
jgi:hypothetical protein